MTSEQTLSEALDHLDADPQTRRDVVGMAAILCDIIAAREAALAERIAVAMETLADAYDNRPNQAAQDVVNSLRHLARSFKDGGV